jgi:hypothetical protein
VAVSLLGRCRPYNPFEFLLWHGIAFCLSRACVYLGLWFRDFIRGHGIDPVFIDQLPKGVGGGLPMSIETRHQLENTRMKLQELEQLYGKIRQDSATSEYVRELTLRSLKKRINQFKDEITRFEARVSPAAPNAS